MVPADKDIPNDGSGILDWVKKLQSGDTSAMTQIIKITQARLYRICYYLTGNHTNAQDLGQDVYLKLLTDIKKSKGFESDAQFVSWLYRVAHNTFISSKRKTAEKIESRKKETRKDETKDLLSRLPEADPHDVEKLLAIKETLNELPEKDRMMIVLLDHNGYSYAEAAEIMNMTEAAVTSRAFKARKKFLEIFHRK